MGKGRGTMGEDRCSDNPIDLAEYRKSRSARVAAGDNESASRLLSAATWRTTANRASRTPLPSSADSNYFRSPGYKTVEEGPLETDYQRVCRLLQSIGMTVWGVK
jgi:hypothetical protein